MTDKHLLSDLRTAPWEHFSLRWRFTEPEHAVLSPPHLEQIRPLDSESADKLWTATLEVHDADPFTPGLFSVVEQMSLAGVHQDPTRADGIRKWLYQRGIPFQREVFLSWQPDTAAQTVWKMLVKHFDAFWYPGSDDLTVVDPSFSWALLFHHEELLFWGGNKPRTAE